LGCLHTMWFFLSIALAAAPQATADTWPHWRGGPEQQGISPSTLPDRLEVRWTTPLREQVVAPPIVTATTVFVGDTSGRFYAVDRVRGEVLWQAQTGGPIEAPALWLNGQVVVGSKDGTLRSFDPQTGAVRWQQALGSPITGGAAWVPATGALPEGLVLGLHDGRLVRLPQDGGAPLWTYRTGSYLYGSPALAEGRLIVGGCDGHVHVVDPATGEALQRVPVAGYVGASPATDGDWATTGHFGNEVLAFQPSTGTPLWTHRDRTFPYLSSPAVSDEVVVVGGRDRSLHAVLRDSGQALWWAPALAKVDASPLIAGQRVVFGAHDGRVRIVSLDDGTLLTEYDLGSPVVSSPALASQTLYVGTEDGRLVALAAPPPAPKKKKAR